MRPILIAQYCGRMIFLAKIYKRSNWKYLTVVEGMTEEYNMMRRREAGVK